MMLGCGETADIKLDVCGEKQNSTQVVLNMHVFITLCFIRQCCHRTRDDHRSCTPGPLPRVRGKRRATSAGWIADVFPNWESHHTLKLQEYFHWNVSPARRGDLLRSLYGGHIDEVLGQGKLLSLKVFSSA